MHSPSSILPLSVRDLTFVAGGKTIIDRISFDLRHGQRTVILGPNGAGKSVLLRLCHGLLVPSGGSIVWGGGQPHPERRQAMVFQRPVMLRRSALANITYALKLAGVSRAERGMRAHAALAKVGLDRLADSPARVLSGGEQQRLALARAWALAPEVLFLDEPTANLDPGATRMIEEAIAVIHANGTKIVMTTHDLGQARRIADEVIFLHRGRVLEHSPAARFFDQPATPEAAAFIRGDLIW
ncbi:MAG TPA: ATP-binding cassette domain-containing protein [Alphaproteobacteria bacterium]